MRLKFVKSFNIMHLEIAFCWCMEWDYQRPLQRDESFEKFNNGEVIRQKQNCTLTLLQFAIMQINWYRYIVWVQRNWNCIYSDHAILLNVYPVAMKAITTTLKTWNILVTCGHVKMILSHPPTTWKCTNMPHK